MRLRGATIDEMNADTDHDTECRGTMDIIVPEGFEGYVGMTNAILAG